MTHHRGLHPTDPARAISRLAAVDHPTVRGALRGLRGSADLTAFAPIVLSQGASSSCWAHSAVTLLYTRRHILLGGAPVLMSPLYFAQTLYASLRAEATPVGQSLPLMYDTGAQLDDAARCFARWGCSPMGPPQQGGGTDVPATEDDTGAPIAMPELTVTTVESGARLPFGGEYDIAVDGNAGDTCAACLESNIPIWIGGPVGQNLQDYQAGQIEMPPEAGDPSVGGHARAVNGYRVVSGKRQFRIRNSWGVAWGDAGDSWADESVLVGSWALLPFEVS